MARTSAGTIVVLNGPSSAGKTTLASAVRDARAPTAAHVSLDQFFACVAPTRANNWDLFATLTEATFAAAVALANGGFDVLVDTVFERAECLETARSMLVGHMHHLVAVTCALDVLESREMARGDRRPGLARGQFERVLQNATYDLVLDTGLLSLAGCVARVSALMAKGNPERKSINPS